MAESATSARRRTTKSGDATARSEALERLKALRRSGGRRTESGAGIGFQIKMEDPIYDTVAEEDYARIVAERREAAKGFIVGEDGMGYDDEGEEEDWANSALPPSSDEDDGPIAAAERSRKKKAPKKEAPPKKPPPTSLSAAAALMGKQKLSAMFTSAAFIRSDKGKGPSLSSESIVDDLIAECTPDEADREERRRQRGGPLTTVPLSGILSYAAASHLPTKDEHLGGPSDSRSTLQLTIPTSTIEIGSFHNDHKENRDQVDLKHSATRAEEQNIPKFASSDTSGNSHMDVEQLSTLVLKSESIVEREKEVTLNAKITVEKDHNASSATAGWKAICEGDSGRLDPGVSSLESSDTTEQTEFELDADGSLNFYLIDAHEESFGANSGTIYLFGKVKVGNSYHSCCVVVKNMQRCVFAIPRSCIFRDTAVLDIEKNADASQISRASIRAKLQEMASELKNEVSSILVDHNISSFSMTPVKRGYAFERSDIPFGEQCVLKITYPFKNPPLPADLKGNQFIGLIGTTYSALELLLVKRKIKGPSWLSILKFFPSPAHQRVSWCKFEVTVESPKDICVSTSKATLETPPVTVTAINLKTLINEKQNANEIISASLICCHKAKIDGPMVASEWKRPGILSHITVVRKLEGGIFPMGFAKEATDRNAKAGSNVLALESSERALLNRLMIELHKLDSDVLVGHNISGFDLDVLLHRAQACKVPSSMWSKIGRLKRSVMPKLTKGNTVFGSGASLGIMSCIAGRLLCDTYLCSRDLLREVSYSLTQLAKTQLSKERREIAPHDIPSMFQMTASLMDLVECGETDAWLSLELMFHLSILPLTRQLTNISGNVWGRTLQGARAQRVEFLLLHAFHAKKYIVPDKNSTRGKELNTGKRKPNTGVESEDADVLNMDDISFENDRQTDQVKGKKGPAYAGGLVLEPKKGLYDRYVLLLDFNSLYPSIIQEYNVCFTTVERSPDGLEPNLPSSKAVGVLPELLRNLVERRKMVKSWLKNASGLKVQQLDIQQQALKLTANSMYGCLGFSNSRFYAKPLAELITLQGREILQSTVDLVQNNLNLEVIYGDTDSIMIYSGLDDIAKVKAMAGKVIQEVNKKYRCLEIDLDGLYKRMLLLKKKKYAAVKVLFKDGTPYEVIERKGLDMVRRDWSLLSKEIGDFCLSQILSGGTCEDVVESIHSSLMKVQEEMRNGEITLEKYVITKTLTKAPEEYPDKRNQPHVQVALRLKQNGYFTGCSAGDTVPYVICCQKGESSFSTGIAERARHPDELKRDNSGWMIDIEYYLSQQIHPVVSRLCASIQGTSPGRLADCLGLDSTKFQQKTAEPFAKDPSSTPLSIMDEDERYNGCEALQLSCPSCSCSFECPPVSSLFSNLSSGIPVDTQAGNSFWRRMCCPRCPQDNEGSRFSPAMLANQVKRNVEKFQSMYYRALMMCDDEMCKYTARSLNLRVLGDSERGTVCPNYPRCNGRLVRQYTEADLYKQLSYFCYILDATRCFEKLDNDSRTQFERDLGQVYLLTDMALSKVQKIRDRCSYGWVQLKDLCVSV